MINRLITLVLILAAFLPCACPAQSQVKKKVAVYMTGDADERDKDVVGSTLVTALTRSDDYVAVERTTDFIEAINKEIDEGVSGNVRDRDIAAIGQRFGAKYVAVVNVFENRDEMFIAARMIDVETAAVVASCEESASVDTMEQLRTLARNVASRLVGLNLNNSGRRQVGMSNGQNQTFTVNGISFEMVPVQGGSFMMGSYEGFENERPVHQETVGDFMIGKTEVTQELWRAVMGSNPSYFSGEKNPVERVSWTDCIAFIGRLNQLTGQNFRLPTEAEWEYAARGGNKSKNYKYSGSDDLYLVGWFDGNAGGRTHPVANLQPNELGLYDMSGNVYEWTVDIYSNNYNAPRNTSYRVKRGGSYDSYATFCRVAYRGGNTPGGTYYYLGLRLAL